jgi:hypothetical protein
MRCIRSTGLYTSLHAMYKRPHTTIHVSCFRILVYVSSYYYMCPHTGICVLMLRYVSAYWYVCPHATICVRILVCVCSCYICESFLTCYLLYMCQLSYLLPSSRLKYNGMRTHIAVCGNMYSCMRTRT